MKIHVLGTAGYHPNESRQTTCLMIPEIGMVFDAGTSFFRVRDLLQTDYLNIFLTHAHLDHVAGLTFLLDVLHEKPISNVQLFAEQEKLDAIRSTLFHPLLFPVDPPYIECPLGGPVQLQDVSIRFCQLDHPGGSIGYRLDWEDKSLAIITDTTADTKADYVAFIEGVDLLIHECNFKDGFEPVAELTGHSCTSGVCEVANAANAKRLVLIHLNPMYPDDDALDLDVARSIFPNTEISFDRMILDI